MNCPVCKKHALKVQDIETGLKSQECPNCGGRWIGSYVYWKWKEQTGKTLAASLPEQAEPVVKDSTAAKLCPECGHFLRRYPVDHEMGFTLDRCGNCGGMWFDQNEWEALKSRGLHKDVHMVFSNMWQNRIRDKQRQAAAESIYKRMFGPEDYMRICEVKDWLSKHPHAAELRAFLND